MADIVVEAMADGAPEWKNYYYYVGWMAHADAQEFRDNTIMAWQAGWTARAALARAEVWDMIANDPGSILSPTPPHAV